MDVQTRWNTTYLILGAALEYGKAFEQFKDQDLALVSELKEGVMNDADWMISKSLRVFLEHFFVATKRVLGSPYVTSNSFFHEVYGI